MENELFKNISSLFIFNNVTPRRLCELLENVSPEFEIFTHGQLIYSPSEFSTKIGFVIKGGCTVERHRSDGTAIPLNSLKAGDAFGVLSAFSTAAEFPTYIKTKKDAQIVFFTKADMLYLVKNEPEIAINIIYFLGNRIAFLNDKISTFSSDNTEQKVAKFLVYEVQKNDSLTFAFNCKKTSEALNIGRASLYRAIDSLTQRGILTLENKIINISDLDGLERTTK